MDDTELDPARLNLYSYLTAGQSEQHVRIMRVLAGEVLTRQMSAAEISAKLSSDGYTVNEEDVEARCKQLVDWGNIIPSVRNYRVATIAELRRTKSRYQASKLGVRIASDVDEILGADDGAKEVARELLDVIAEQLGRVLAELKSDRKPDADAVASAVSTAFNNHQVFAGSLRDFNAYLGGVLARYDIVGEDFTVLKTTLMMYIDILRTDVRRHGPKIHDLLTQLEPHYRQVTDILASWQTLTLVGAERGQGRAESDWERLTSWYAESGENSGPWQFRTATEQALGQLLVNAKRILTDAGSGYSRRDDLIRLAGMFAVTDDGDAHRLFANTFGVYSWRHLLLGDSESVQPSANTSWWNAPQVDVPVTLRERGDRTARGRTSPVPDSTLETRLAYDAAARQVEIRRLAVTELLAAGTLDGVKLSPVAQELLQDQITKMAGESGALSSDNRESGFTLRREPITGTSSVQFDGGMFTVYGFRYHATPIEEAVAEQGEATG